MTGIARPKKSRKICHFPKVRTFMPAGEQIQKEPILLSMDEYETLRLIDKEGKSQEECSVSMKVARTTVQMIYTAARKKVADAIVDARPLEIEGGDYDLCDGRPEYCSRSDCYKKKVYQRYKRMEAVELRIAVPFNEHKVYEDFGQAPGFKLYDVKGGKIVASDFVDTTETGYGCVSELLHT